MKPIHSSTRWHVRLAAALCAWGLAATAFGAAPALTPQIVLRPVTPGDVTKYKLPGTVETSGGLTTVGLGTPVYLEMEISSTYPLSGVSNVTWALTSVPTTSVAYLTNSPLGTNVPVYEPSDALIYQVAGRALLRPDVRGEYTITATITTAAGSTNLTQNITAGVYMGLNTCALCHSGGEIAPDRVTPWSTTAHSMIFTEGINGQLGFYSQSCLQCHTVGYDTNTVSFPDNGFFSTATALGWQFPSVLTNSNFSSLQTNYPALANLANIQCENCHGPGSEHAYSLGNTNLISVTVNSGDCNQCHDAPTHHVYGTEWYASAHAVTTRIPSGAGREVCVGCHTANGFINRINGATGPTNTVYSAIGCQTCHEPHGLTMPTNNPHLLRTLESVTMGDGTVVTNSAEGLLCLECHHSRNGSAVANVANYKSAMPTWIGGSSFGPHDGPQGDMVLGVNAITYGKTIANSAHQSAITNLCVTCHMQATATTDPGFLIAGAHTFKMSSTNSSGALVEMTAACQQCHGAITNFDFVRADYNGDGGFSGVQEQVQGLLNTLSTYLPNKSGVVDGTIKASLSVTTNWTTAQLNAAYNWDFVSSDGSMGIHNIPYAIGILQASIADLSGSATNNAALQAWQVQYFGSTTAANAGLNASPAGDGIPNWLKYQLGLNPNIAGIAVTNGVIWANTFSGGTTNTVQIYTAAEISFDTLVGTSYQIQGIDSLSETWQNIGAPIAGNGNSVSYLTPTHDTVQQFYRVVHTP